MMIPCEKLREWAETVDPAIRIYLNQFLNESEAKMMAEIDRAKKCLAGYGIKTYEDQYHKVHEAA